MKNNCKLLVTAVFLLFVISCTKNNTTSTTPSSEYAGYDFYIAGEGCGLNEFTKNFQKISGYDKAFRFNLVGNNIYTFGEKKYRSENSSLITYISGSNYSGFISKNNTEIFSNIGGKSSSVNAVQEVGGNIFFVTSPYGEGATSTDVIRQHFPAAKVFKNGSVIDSLKGPFRNRDYYNKNNYYALVEARDIVIKASDVYVSGMCQNYKSSDTTSYGYWKNGIYKELKRGYKHPVVYSYTKFLISDIGDVYYGFQSSSGVTLFKNGTDLINGKLKNTYFYDFAFLNNDIYLLGDYYQNGDKLGIYKNGILDYSTSIYPSSYDNYKIQVLDGKIFICGAKIGTNTEMTVFEYKPISKTLVKVGNTGLDYQGCSVSVLDFQVKLK
ncbi:MAG: hypothetical protein ACOVO1_12820 [Chitinophagaceae bacterium]